MKKRLILLLFSIALASGLSVQAQMSSSAIDSLAVLTLKTFDVPGMAIGVVHNGKVIHAKGYGVRSLKTMQPVDENTLFGIASNSKAFTTTALAMLADEGKLHWDDKVRKYIPEFTLYNPFVSEEFTIRDLVTHRSGLGLGAGDLMFFPEGGDISVQDIIHNLRYLKRESSFRSKYEYNNNLYIVAGEVIRRVSGMHWDTFIETRLLQPVGMTSSKASYNRVTQRNNIIDAHAPVNGKVEAIPHDWNETANAAGGIMSNITDLSKWVITQLNEGVMSNGNRLVSAKQHREMWTIQTMNPVAPNGPYQTQFNGYGLGWVISDVKGKKQVGHTGGLIGTVTQITMIPELKLGIIVLTNQQSGAAFLSVTNSIKDSYLGYENRDWVGDYNKRMQQLFADANRITDSVYQLSARQVKLRQSNPLAVVPDSMITGVYHDLKMGEMHISPNGKQLNISFVRSPRLTGTLLPLNATTWIARWNDRSYDADAYAEFIFDHTGKAQEIKMKAISPMTDFSFDFHNLELKRRE
ncbi:MAG TPA: serine hydrolase [Ferruginibacter sp.]|nr:serine hydrolase [Ferruginibacter sp.]